MGRRPKVYRSPVSWVGQTVWHATLRGILDEPGIALFAPHGTGVAHCPCSNMRPWPRHTPHPQDAATAGVKVGTGGVDAAPRNRQQIHLLDEARMAMLTSACATTETPGANATAVYR